MSASEIQPARTISEFRFNSPELPRDQFGPALTALVAGSPCRRIAYDYRIYAGHDRPIAEKRISVWLRHDKDPEGQDREEPLWRLYYQLVSDLHIAAYDGSGRAIPHSTDNRQAVFVQDGAIVLQGGYLEVHDPAEPLRGMGLPMGITQSTSLTNEKCPDFDWPVKGPLASNLGRSIHLEVDFAGPVQAKAMQPLFYFPQPNLDKSASDLGAVCVGVEAEGDKRRMLWAISGAGLRSAPYDTGVPELRHTLTVSADYNWLESWAKQEEKVAWFELLVDSLGLFPVQDAAGESDNTAAPDDAGGSRVEQPEAKIGSTKKEADKRGIRPERVNVDFGMRGRKFYIGHAPPADEERSGFAPERWMWSGPFHGRIHRIFFDPTTNCNNC